ncbi:S-adenosyl-L-methionine-dependent methyltransferase [Delitschia confertaspora ATCC 74209]|uniref:rRNA adenine N(6)-methyltransferase n=1 Tax=Delitschia confertaspora ATCC 74209 TaxID=1513339 RepID=A0A9P4JN94_9PLEO|nr:S-adenosyl-L-methionine-dependent methyltransferase [Delitschia confertaspora ATCC 74209]
MLSLIRSLRPRPVSATVQQCLRIQRRNVARKEATTKKKGGRPVGKTGFSKEQLETAEQYPLSQELAKNFVPIVTHRGRKKHSYSRPQIVSPELCDDVLSYIGPTLERHRGCDIIDINPGAGLWSSKLHEFLQPRKHILVESNPEIFEQHLKNLVEQPGSRYKLVTGDISKFEFFEDIMKEHIRPDQPPLDPNDPRINEPNDKLLVTGSLISNPIVPGYGIKSLVRQLLLYFNEIALTHGLFHSHGRARQLFWMNNEEVSSMLPKTIVQQHKLPIIMDRLCDITEVVASESTARGTGTGNLKRDASLELESVVRSLELGKKSGFELPAHRRTSFHDFADDVSAMTNGTGIITPAELLDYLREAEASGKSTAGLLNESLRELFKEEEKKTAGSRGTRTKKGEQLSILRSTSLYVERSRETRWHVINLAEQIHKLECDILRTSNEAQKQELQSKLDTLESEYQTRASKLSSMNRGYLAGGFDDRLAVRSPTKRLLWDRRPFEPLSSHPEEAWPKTRTALFDIMPRAIPAGTANASEDFEYFKDLIQPLFDIPSLPLHQAVEGLAPGASELLKEVEALSDPEKGGRLNLNDFRVRMLTTEMVEQLSKAFREWPFRPPGSDHPNFFRSKWHSKFEGEDRM